MRMYMCNIAAGENKAGAFYLVNRLHGLGKPLSKLHHAGSKIRGKIIKISIMHTWDKLHMTRPYGIDIQESHELMIFVHDMRRNIPVGNCAKKA